MSIQLHGLRTAIYPTSDLVAAKAWWTTYLGFGPYFDEPFYVGFEERVLRDRDLHVHARARRRSLPRSLRRRRGRRRHRTTGAVLVGRLRPRQTRLVQTWAELHRAELLEAWNRASSGEPLGTIEPLP